jgi:hypothetical protein
MTLKEQEEMARALGQADTQRLNKEATRALMNAQYSNDGVLGLVVDLMARIERLERKLTAYRDHPMAPRD